MGDEEGIEKLMATVAQQQASMKQQQDQIFGLVDTIKAMPGVSNPVSVTVNAPPVDPDVARAEKVQKLAMCLRKSNRIKVFKHTSDSDIKLYIKKFDEEIRALKPMVGITNALTDAEYVPLFRATLDFCVLERVEQAFKKNPAAVLTWNALTKDQLHKVMTEEFGVKETDVANVLQQFGPSRLHKPSDKPVSEFYFEWFQNIPSIMKPSTDEEYKAFSDLILRSMFYISLDDTYLQQALSDLKTPNSTLRTYMEEAIAAESRRKCFQDISTTSSTLGSKNDISIAKWEFQNGNKKSWDKDANFKGVRNKTKFSDSAQSKNNNGGNGQNQKKNQNPNQKQNFDQKAKQNSDQNQNQKSKAGKNRFCDHCQTKTHYTESCWILKRKAKQKSQINNMDIDQDNQQSNCQSVNDDFGTFNALCAVDQNLRLINSFSTKPESHPLVTSESIMTTFNLVMIDSVVANG